MISSYNEETSVYTCYFTREEYQNLLRLATAGVCRYHGYEHCAHMQELRTLRDELLEGHVIL